MSENMRTPSTSVALVGVTGYGATHLNRLLSLHDNQHHRLRETVQLTMDSLPISPA